MAPSGIAEPVVEMPANAPQVRITAGVGSAGQKTWNLRRPVTLLGSRRPSHIVLHDRGVSAVHCAIVNTGTDVLLFDLHTTTGTMRGKERIDLVALQDGDVIALGETVVQVAFRLPASDPDDSGAGLEYCDPVSLANPATFTLIHTDSRWNLERAVALIGRHDQAAIRLDHSDVTKRHALVFRFGRDLGIYDLGGRSGVWVNGRRCEISSVADGDRVTIGPFGLHVQIHNRSCSALSPEPAIAASQPAECMGAANAAGDSETGNSGRGENKSPSRAPTSTGGRSWEPGEPDPLQTNIAEAWERLNQWRAQLRHDAEALNEQQSGLAAREAQIEARDAALRGQLHDITRFNEELAQREKELAQRIAQMQVQADTLSAAQKDFLDKQIESQKREEDLHRREQALNQRWSRMQSVVCPHCQKPVGLGTT